VFIGGQTWVGLPNATSNECECNEMINYLMQNVNLVRHAVRALHQSIKNVSSNLYLRFWFWPGMMRVHEHEQGIAQG
jgi:hypothetical protein